MLHLQFYVSSGAAQEAGATGYNLRAQLRSEARMFEHGGYTPARLGDPLHAIARHLKRN